MDWDEWVSSLSSPYNSLMRVLSLGLMLVLSLGPWAFHRITTFIREQINTALGRQIQVHYHRLDLVDQGYDVPDDSPPLEAA